MKITVCLNSLVNKPSDLNSCVLVKFFEKKYLIYDNRLL